MKLESALKYFNPKSQQITDTSRATGTENLTGTDLMGAIGYCQTKSPFGTAAVLAKSGISDTDAIRAVEQLFQYARKITPPLVAKSAGTRLVKCLAVLSKLAFEEYTRSAATVTQCRECYGHGLKYNVRYVMIHPGCGEPASERYTAPKFRIDDVGDLCQTCKGKGLISARCRCQGTGRMRDTAESKRRGVPVDKECNRCGGKGFKRSPATRAYRAVAFLLPGLNERSWNRNWKPFYEKLVAKCEAEENHADSVFRKMTR